MGDLNKQPALYLAHHMVTLAFKQITTCSGLQSNDKLDDPQIKNTCALVRMLFEKSIVGEPLQNLLPLSVSAIVQTLLD